MQSGSAARVLVVAALACGCKGETPGPSPAPAPPKVSTTADAAPPAVAGAAGALAKTFATELVGDITPVAPVAGEYAMALTLEFTTFVTTELRIDDDLKGALKLTLAGDGTAHACIGAIHHHASAGQIHYEKDPAKRKHSELDEAQLSALAGTWTVADGVAVIRFDRSAERTCDATSAIVVTTAPVAELRCIGITGTALVPAGSLLCDATEPGRLRALGMPLTEASRAGGDRRDRAPTGGSFVLGAPGVVVEVRQPARADQPSITFVAGAAPLVEADYLQPPR